MRDASGSLGLDAKCNLQHVGIGQYCPCDPVLFGRIFSESPPARPSFRPLPCPNRYATSNQPFGATQSYAFCPGYDRSRPLLLSATTVVRTPGDTCEEKAQTYRVAVASANTGNFPLARPFLSCVAYTMYLTHKFALLHFIAPTSLAICTPHSLG